MAEALATPTSKVTDFCENILLKMAVGGGVDVTLNGAKGNAQLFCIERTATPTEIALRFRLFVHGVSTKELQATRKNGDWRLS